VTKHEIQISYNTRVTVRGIKKNPAATNKILVY
jgi:hypothetical protein